MLRWTEEPPAMKTIWNVLQLHGPYLHSLIGLTAEVLRTQIGEEVCGHGRQERSDPGLEPLADERGIRELCGGEVVDYHLPDGIKEGRVWQTDVGDLQEMVDTSGYSSNRTFRIQSGTRTRPVPCRSTSELPGGGLQTSGGTASRPLWRSPQVVPACMSVV